MNDPMPTDGEGLTAQEARVGPQRPGRCEMLFDGTFRGKGWYPTEHVPEFCFRWMGGDQSATIDLAVERRADLEIRVYVPFIIDLTQWDAVGFAVDDVPTAFVRENTAVHETVEMNYYLLQVPAAPEHRGVTRLRIDTPFGGQPSRLDSRRLSIGVCRVIARPRPHPGITRTQEILDASVSTYLRHLADAAPVRVAVAAA